MKKNNKKGFTIVELAIVIAVIAILAAVLIPTFTVIIGNAKDTAALANCKTAYDQAIVAVITNDESDSDDMEGYIFENDGRSYKVVDGQLTKQNSVLATDSIKTDGATVKYTYDAEGTIYVAVTFEDVSSTVKVYKPVKQSN